MKTLQQQQQQHHLLMQHNGRCDSSTSASSATASSSVGAGAAVAGGCCYSSRLVFLIAVTVLAMLSLLPEQRRVQHVVFEEQQEKRNDAVVAAAATSTTADDSVACHNESAAVAAAAAAAAAADDDETAAAVAGVDAKQQPVRPIRQISILGERNSGTRWTFDHLSECFNSTGTGIPVEKRLTRYKHWFQYRNDDKYLHDTLVLAQFRNPYDWLKAMEHVPHHSPAHMRTATAADETSRNSQNDWRVFLTKPWTTDRVGADLLLTGNETSCQDDFAYRDVVSCVKEPLPHSYYNHTLRYSEHQPFYEMKNDGSGEPYENIVEMRTDKIRNFLSVADYRGVTDVWVVQYEYLLQAGTQHLLDRISEWTGLAPTCRAKPAQNRKQKKSRIITAEFAAHVRRHVNWTVENMIGYHVELHREEEPAEW